MPYQQSPRQRMQHAQGSIRSTMHGAFAGWLRDHVRWALMLLLVFSGILGPISQNGTALFPTASAHGLSASTPPNPNHLSPSANTTSVKHPNLGKGTTANAPAGPPQSLKRTGGISMQPGKLALAAGHATTFKGSDGRLEIDVPSGAVTSADVAAAGGYMSLLISQIAPASGSSAGGSGIVSFGTYLVQAVDAQGVLLTHGLRQPVTLKLHYAARESALDLSHAFAVFNGPLPDATDLAPLSLAVHLQQPGRIAGGAIDDSSSAVTPTMANSHFGAHASQAASLDTKGQSLVVPLTLKDPSGSMSFNTDSPVATFGKPDPFNVDLNAGALTSSFPIDVPSGPGGLTPPVDLTYSSAGVSEQHNPQGADGWVGEGWNLDLGSISWAEHNSNASCTSGCGNGWEDSWDLSDPFGTSVELIPPNINVATYFDDTTNGITASPIRWHTTPENYAKVYSYTSSLTLPDGAGVHPPCFRVFLTNGIMEEFGCTADSLEYYYAAGKGDYISSWKLDLITDRQGNQIHITYQQASGSYWYGTGYHTFVMDAVLNTIEWDSPSCHDAQNMCAGANWAPLMRVSFAASLVPSRLTSTLGTCNPASWYRCDDPLDLSPSGGLYPPEVQSVYALNDVYVQVRGSGTGSWNTLKDYQFSYAQKGPTGYNDPTTGKAASAAGYLWLTRLVTVGDDGATALPPRTFSYAWVNNYYVDDVYHPHSNAGCWPVWNTGTGSGCLLWNVSYDNNSWYLATADNGMGLHQTFNWATARNNSHGVNGRGSNDYDPLYCDGLSDAAKATYPCNEADDQNWSHVVLTQQEGDVVQSSSGGTPTIKSITQYAYHLTALPNQACSDCVAGMYWGNQNNGDYLDYYDAKFMGFAEADVGNPDGSVEYHKYLSTEGYGLYDATVPCLAYVLPCHVSPWWDIGNAGHGHEYETDYFDTNGTTLLKKVTSQYQLVCPPNGIAGSPSWSTTLNGSPYTYTWDGMLVAALDHGNPVADCDVQTKSSDTYTLDGASDPFAVPHSSASYGYDSLGHLTDTTTGVDTGLKAAYYDNSGLTGSPAFTRLDATVNNSWGTSSPFPTIGPDTFSVRWTGYVQPQYSGTYTFYTNSDDGARLWVNGTELVNNWTNHALTENSGTIALTAGQRYPITLEYYENTAGATIQLSWSEASQAKQIIPATAFFTRSDGGGGTALGSVPATVAQTDYIWNDAVTATSTSATGTYLLDVPLDAVTRDGGSTVHYSCTFYGYDGLGWAPGQQSGLTLGEVTTKDQYTNCGTAAGNFGPSGLLRTSYTYDTYGNQLTTTDPDASAGNTAHTGCTVGGTQYSTCAAFDGVFHTLTTSTTNALNQSEATDYGTPAASNGFGSWPISTTDKNGQATSYGYDALDRMTSRTLPGETSAPTTSWAYTDWCAATGEQAPCLEVDSTQRLDSSDTITSRAFYDGYGNLIETRDPGPNGQDVVRYRVFDVSGRDVKDSIPYFVASYSGGPGAAAFATPDSNQHGTLTAYDGLGRALTVTDPLGGVTTTSYITECGWDAPSDPACYAVTFTYDPLQHQTLALSDGLGRLDRNAVSTGNSPSTWAWYTEVDSTYDANGQLVKLLHQNFTSATTYTYDAAGRKTGMTDPDLGSETYAYDADGNLTQATDARGSSGGGVIYAGYDGLNRQLWRNTANSPTGAYATYTYDQTTGHGAGIGHLTTEGFTSGTTAQPLHGSYSYTYDTRGETTGLTLTTTENATYPLSFAYNDAGAPTGLTFSDGEVFSNVYDSASGWLSSAVTTPSGGSQINLLTNVTYSGVGGAAGHLTSATLANGTYSYSASYDTDLRLTSMSLSNMALGTTLFGSSRSYDADSNVTAVTTTLASGTDNQAFCYDDLNRLVWAGSTGTPSCGGTLSAGTLTSAAYTATYSYDTLNRLTSGPLGSYTYGDSAHLDAATQAGTGGTAYTASYDAAGDMRCRAPSGSTTCTGSSPTGAQMTYDAERRLTSWQNAPTAPTSQAWYLYDGEGHRVEQDSSSGGGSDTHTYYLPGNAEEVTPSGSLVKYYSAGGLTLGENTASDASGIAYLVSDGLGSVTEALNSSGTATGSLLYGPYGGVRYSNGAMPTSKGFTGQYADASTGLDYYGARYYDPTLGQFTSADSVTDGLNRYGYVKGNPETATDPTGHRCSTEDGGVCGTGGNGSGRSGNGCHSDGSCGCYSDCGGGHGGYLGNFGGGCNSVSTCQCHSLAECTGVEHPEVGHPCSDDTACFQGNDPDGLFHYLLHEQGQDAASITLNGKSGIEWFLNLLNQFQTSVDQAFDDKINHAEVSAAVITAALTIIGALAGAGIGGAAGFVIGGALTGGTTATLIANYQDQKSTFNSMILNFRQQLVDVEGQLTDNSNTEIVIAPVTPQGPLEGWEDQQLQITDVFRSP